MADEQENIKIRFDSNAKEVATGNNSLAKSLDGVEDSAKDASKSMKSLDATFEDVYGDLKPLTARMGEAEDRLYELALAGQQATEEYKKLLEVVANYRKTQIQTDAVVDAAATTLGQKLAGASSMAATGIQGVTAGMALFGDQSEDTEKALLKVQAAMSFADAIGNISSMKGQFKVFKSLVVDAYNKIIAKKVADKVATDAGTVSQLRQNLAVLANPYVLLTVAIAALSVGIYAWVKASSAAAAQEERVRRALGENKIATENLGKEIEETGNKTKVANEIEVLRAKAYGATDEEIKNLIKSQRELSVGQAADLEKKAWENLIKAQDLHYNATKTGNEDLIKEATEAVEKAKEVQQKAMSEYTTSINENIKGRLQDQIDSNKQAQEEADKANKLRLEKLKKAQEERLALLREGRDKEASILRDVENIYDKTEEQKLQRQKERDLLEIERLRQRGFDVANILAYNEEKYVELERDLRLKRAEEKEKADKEAKEKADKLEREYWEEQADISIKRTEQQKKVDEYALEQKRVIKDKELDIAENSVKLLSSVLGKSKGIQKAALIAESAVGIGKTVQGVFTGNAAALAQGITQAGPIAGPALAAPAIALNSVQGALSVAGNIAATTKALQAVGGGSISGSSAGGSSAAVGAGGQSNARPSIAFNNSSENQIGQSLARSQADQPPLQVFVAESDITKSQNNVKVLVETNTF